MAEKMTIEQGFGKLGEIMERMEETDISLEESFRLYNKGIKLVKQIKEKLDDTEKKLIVLEEQQI